MLICLTRTFQRLSGFLWRTLFSIWEKIHDCISKTIFILQYIFLGLLCIGIDILLSVPMIRNNDYLRAFTDNFGHGLIAAVSWLIVSGAHKKSVLQGIWCMLISSAIDLDHFAMAKSLKIKDAVSLHTRPPLHTTTIVPIVTPILQVWFAQHIKILEDLPYMFVVAVLSHHLRDAHRRGLWFWPFGSTPPLPYGIYIICITLLPMVVKDTRSSIKSLHVTIHREIIISEDHIHLRTN